MTMISAHRGGSDLDITANDDTYLHFKRAIESDAELVEFDARKTKDGVFVCHHDEAIEGLGDVADMDSSALQGYESIIPVDALLKMAAGKTICHIDLKSTGDEIALVDSAIDILGPEGFVITSLEAGSVARIRRERPEVQAVLTLGRGSKGMRLADVLRVRAHELIPFKAIRECHATGIAVEWRLATPPLLRYARRHGLTAMVWTVNKDWQLRHFLRNDAVDIVITDRPAAAMAIRRATDGTRKADG
jgi:glycerophosphoryl diester phosphodiesterase